MFLIEKIDLKGSLFALKHHPKDAAYKIPLIGISFAISMIKHSIKISTYRKKFIELALFYNPMLLVSYKKHLQRSLNPKKSSFILSVIELHMLFEQKN